MKYNILEIHYNGDDVTWTAIREFKFDSYSEAKSKVVAYMALDIIMNYPNKTEYHVVCVDDH